MHMWTTKHGERVGKRKENSRRIQSSTPLLRLSQSQHTYATRGRKKPLHLYINLPPLSSFKVHSKLAHHAPKKIHPTHQSLEAYKSLLNSLLPWGSLLWSSCWCRAPWACACARVPPWAVHSGAGGSSPRSRSPSAFDGTDGAASCSWRLAGSSIYYLQARGAFTSTNSWMY